MPMISLLFEPRTLIVFEGTPYRAEVWGAPALDRTACWHAWIDFLPIDGGLPIRTMRETTQPNRSCAVYWAAGLRPTYLEGALQRARVRRADRPRRRAVRVKTSSPLRLRPAAGGGPASSGIRRTPRFHLTATDRRLLASLGISSQ